MSSKLVKNSLIYAIGDIAPRLLSFISFPILTRYLSPAEYGIVNYVNTVNLFLMTIGFLCLNTYYLVYYYKQPTEEDRRKLLGNLSIFIIGLNLIMTLLCFGVGPKLITKFESNISFYPYLAIGLVTNLFGLVSVLPTALYRLEENPLPLTIINVVRGVINLGITIWFVVGLGFKAEGLLFSQMIVTIVFGLIFIKITLNNMIWTFNWKQLKTALIFSLPLLPGSLSYLLTTMFDRILIDKYLNLTDLGIYSSASTLALILNIISYGAYKAFEPYIFKHIDSPDFAGLFTKLRNGLFWVLLSGAFGLALFAREFFQIFSEQQYHTAYLYVPVILIGVFCSAIGMPYGTVITAHGHTKINSALSICGGVTSVTLNIFLLSRLGIIAACITSALTMTLTLIASIHFSHLKISHTPPLLAFLLTAVATLTMVYFIPIPQLWLSIVAKTIVFLIIIIISSKTIGISIKFLNKFNPFATNRSCE